ncbi:MAG TPA: hypothetical protein VNT60_05345 [Deinococcales bacterium]|nr:hypothetical protein [Deinococcales bacterium]
MPFLVLLAIAALVTFGILLAGMRAAARSDERLGLDQLADGTPGRLGDGEARPANQQADSGKHLIS